MSPLSVWSAQFLVLSALFALVSSAPVAIDVQRIDLYHVCSSVICNYGSAMFNTTTRLCACPTWFGENFNDPCQSLDCPFGQAQAYSFLTNQCHCEPICSLQECRGMKISVYSPIAGSCACIPDCGALRDCRGGNSRAEFSFEENRCFCEETPVEERDWVKFHEILNADFQSRQLQNLRRGIEVRQDAATTTMSVSAQTATPTPSPTPGANDTSAANFTFIPPPNIDITPALIQQALNDQPQTTVVISGIKTYFLDGIMQYQVQLAGLVAATIPMNASTTIPCGSMGIDPEPGLVVVPKTVKQGTPQLSLTSCLVIAVNMYNPNYITYWIQLINGTLISLLSDNKVHDINLIDPNAGSDLTVLTTPAALSSLSKRGEGFVAPMKITAPDQLRKRGMEEIDFYTTKMTAEACAAMTCNNNGGTVASFNPFLEVCYCRTPNYVEVNPSGEGSAVN